MSRDFKTLRIFVLGLMVGGLGACSSSGAFSGESAAAKKSTKVVTTESDSTDEETSEAAKKSVATAPAPVATDDFKQADASVPISGVNLTIACEWRAVVAESVRAACGLVGEVPAGTTFAWSIPDAVIESGALDARVEFTIARAKVLTLQLRVDVGVDVPVRAAIKTALPKLAVGKLGRCLGSKEELGGCFSSSGFTLGAEGQLSLPVEAPPQEHTLLSIAVTPVDAVIPNGGKRRMQAIATYADGESEDLTESATWSSTAPAVATVNGADVTAIAIGTATIEATQDGVTGSASIAVSAGTLTGIELLPPTAEVGKGGLARFRLIGKYSNGAEQDLTDQATWTSLNTATATAVPDVNGDFAAVEVGASDLKAEFGGFVANGNLTVTAEAPGLVFHFDASSRASFNDGGIDNGNLVTAYVEQSVTARSAKVVQGANVVFVEDGVNGRPAMQLNAGGGLQFAHDAGLGFDEFTFVLVGKHSAKQCWQVMFLKDDPGSWTSGFGFTDRVCSGVEGWQFWINNYSRPANYIDFGEIGPRAFVMIGTYRNGEITLLDDKAGTAMKMAVPAFAPNTKPLYIGGYAAKDLLVSELKIYERELTEAERGGVMERAKGKWGF